MNPLREKMKLGSFAREISDLFPDKTEEQINQLLDWLKEKQGG